MTPFCGFTIFNVSQKWHYVIWRSHGIFIFGHLGRLSFPSNHIYRAFEHLFKEIVYENGGSQHERSEEIKTGNVCSDSFTHLWTFLSSKSDVIIIFNYHAHFWYHMFAGWCTCSSKSSATPEDQLDGQRLLAQEFCITTFQAICLILATLWLLVSCSNFELG